MQQKQHQCCLYVYRALIWMPLWVVILNFDVFCVSMTAQYNIERMPIRECKCELYFNIFIFSVFQRQPRTIWWECLYENANVNWIFEFWFFSVFQWQPRTIWQEDIYGLHTSLIWAEPSILIGVYWDNTILNHLSRIC